MKLFRFLIKRSLQFTRDPGAQHQQFKLIHLSSRNNQDNEAMNYIDQNYFGSAEHIVIKDFGIPNTIEDLVPLDLLAEDNGERNPIEEFYFGGNRANTTIQEVKMSNTTMHKITKDDELHFIDQQFFS